MGWSHRHNLVKWPGSERVTAICATGSARMVVVASNCKHVLAMQNFCYSLTRMSSHFPTFSIPYPKHSEPHSNQYNIMIAYRRKSYFADDGREPNFQGALQQYSLARR